LWSHIRQHGTAAPDFTRVTPPCSWTQSLSVTGAVCLTNPHRNIASTKRETATVLPGWTTLPEIFLMNALVDAAESNVQDAQRLRKALLEGARTIGEASGE